MTKNSVFIVIISFVLLALESSLSSILVPAKYFPDIALILISYISLYSSQNFSITSSFFIGFLQDLSTSTYLGPNSLGSVFASFSIKSLSKNLFSEQIISTSILIFLASLIKSFFAYLLIYFFNRSGNTDLSNFVDFFYKALSSSVFGSLFFLLTSRSKKRALRRNI